MRGRWWCVVEEGERCRVLWLAKGLGQGGMERLLVTHARFGDRERFDYRAAHLVDRPYTVVSELRDLDVEVTRLGTGVASDPRWVRDLARLVRREQIDVVHVHSPAPASVARPLLRAVSPRTRLVYTEHNRWDRYSRPTRWANMLTYRLDHTTLAVSDDCRSTVSPRLRGRVETLVHGIDIDGVVPHRADRNRMRDELGIADGTVVIGTVANLRSQKNYPLLLQVARQITDVDPNVVFLSVGQGPLEADLRALHGRLGLGDRFRFLGFRSDVHSVMSAFDIFCLSSDFEGLPVALMEAMSLGLPVVATSVGGVADAVVPGRDGVLVPPNDAEALADALGTLSSDHDQRQRLAAAPDIVAARFDARRTVACLEAAYLAGVE